MGEVYYLDKNLNRLDMIERYSSFIWSVRYDEHGTFTMKVPLDAVNLSMLRRAFFVEYTESLYLMMIESIFFDKDAHEVTISGDSLEAILKQRLVMSNWTSGTQHDEWRYSGRSSLVASMLVDRFVISGADTIPEDTLPYLVRGSVASGGETISVALKPQNLYDALKNICALDDFGFRMLILRNPNKQIRFDVIRGWDRSVGNPDGRPPVLFKSDLGTLSKMTYLDSIADFKSTGYVLSNGKRVQSVHNGPSKTGWERRVESYDAGQYSTTASIRYRQIQGEMVEKRKAELADGQVQGSAQMFQYNKDYQIGDIVTIESMIGNETQNVRVSEYTHSFDSDGYKEFPTFRPVTLG